MRALLLVLLVTLGGCPVATIEISTIEQLQLIGNDVAYPLDGDYVLTQDIDASDTSGWNDGAGFAPILAIVENQYVPFSGTFDGQGFVIDGLVINRPTSSGIGLFGQILGGTVSNLGITNCQIAGLQDVGALVGNISAYESAPVVDGCFSTGAIVGIGVHSAGVGGLVGNETDATITNCFSTCSVSGVAQLGGLVGITNIGTITNCFSSGAVSGDSYTGGLIGLVFANPPTVTSSYWDTQTSGQATSAGGTGKTTAEMKTQETFTDWDFDTVWDIDGEYPFLRATIVYTLTYAAGSHGAITGTTPQTVFDGGDGTEVVAVPDTGYTFVGWSDYVLTAARTDLDVTADITVVANFAADTAVRIGIHPPPAEAGTLIVTGQWYPSTVGTLGDHKVTQFKELLIKAALVSVANAYSARDVIAQTETAFEKELQPYRITETQQQIRELTRNGKFSIGG